MVLFSKKNCFLRATRKEKGQGQCPWPDPSSSVLAAPLLSALLPGGKRALDLLVQQVGTGAHGVELGCLVRVGRRAFMEEAEHELPRLLVLARAVRDADHTVDAFVAILGLAVDIGDATRPGVAAGLVGKRNGGGKAGDLRRGEIGRCLRGNDRLQIRPHAGEVVVAASHHAIQLVDVSGFQ